MGGLSPIHIAIVVVVLLLVFGPKKLPDLGRSIGSSLREFKKGTEGLAEEVKSGLSESESAPATPAASATPGSGADTADAAEKPVPTTAVTGAPRS
jgi:sec-independent protein translocase protein TatA